MLHSSKTPLQTGGVVPEGGLLSDSAPLAHRGQQQRVRSEQEAPDMLAMSVSHHSSHVSSALKVNDKQ